MQLQQAELELDHKCSHRGQEGHRFFQYSYCDHCSDIHTFLALARKDYKQLVDTDLNFTAGQILLRHFQHHNCVFSLF